MAGDDRVQRRNGSAGQELLEAVQLREWRAKLTATVAALIVFEGITGLVIYFGPFTVSSQLMVLLHTALGIAFVVPYAIYQTHHWLLNRPRPFNQHKLLGYLSLATMVAVAVSGLVLTWQAGWTERISYAWDVVHLVSGLAALAFVVWHVAIILRRHGLQTDPEKARRMKAVQTAFVRRTLGGAAALLAVVFGVSLVVDPVSLERPFPADYQLPYGDNPFAPSLAITSTGGALDPVALAASERCGTGNCHQEIVAEWLPSAHRYASMSPFFQGVQAAMAANNGPESTRYCGGCHDPIALFSGSKNLYSEDLSGIGAKEGVSCVACHSIERTDLRGNANYVIAPQRRYLWEHADAEPTAWLGRFLIRAYPRQHLSSWTRELYKTPEFCAACHKQFIDEEINNVGWVQLQNQYDNWRQSRWHVPDDPEGTITCRECHMRLVASADPAAGDGSDYYRDTGDGKHRHHGFIGANQYLPTLLDLPGAEHHVQLTEAWLRGDTGLPEIAHKWTGGAAIPLEIIAPRTARPGEEVRFQVVAINNKAGHDFPTGPLDIIQAWIEVEVRDGGGDLVFRSGALDERGFLSPDATVFKAEAVDRYGNLIDKHNLWEMVGARFKRTLFPGYSDVATYSFQCPDSAPAPRQPGTNGHLDGDELLITATLKYRKVDQYLVNFLFPEEELTARVTEMSRSQARLRIVTGR